MSIHKSYPYGNVNIPIYCKWHFHPLKFFTRRFEMNYLTRASKHHKQGVLPVEIGFSKPRDANAAQGVGDKRRKRGETMRYVP